MKIKYAIVSSDSNKFFLDFWPLVAKVWNEKFAIKPVLCYIAEERNPDLDLPNSEVVHFKPIPGIPVPFQTLWVRYFQTQKYSDDVVMISDLDMFPLSEEYFIERIKDIPEDSYVHLNPCVDTYGTLPSCYHVAKGRLFNEILDLHDSWEESCKFIYNLKLGRMHTLPHMNESFQWFSDEIYSSKKVFDFMESNKDRVYLIPREKGRRIDRSDWIYKASLLQKQYYYDAHSIRPYNENKHLIFPLLRNKSLPFMYILKYKLRHLRSLIMTRVRKIIFTT